MLNIPSELNAICFLFFVSASSPLSSSYFSCSFVWMGLRRGRTNCVCSCVVEDVKSNKDWCVDEHRYTMHARTAVFTHDNNGTCNTLYLNRQISIRLSAQSFSIYVFFLFCTERRNERKIQFYYKIQTQNESNRKRKILISLRKIYMKIIQRRRVKGKGDRSRASRSHTRSDFVFISQARYKQRNGFVVFRIVSLSSSSTSSLTTFDCLDENLSPLRCGNSLRLFISSTSSALYATCNDFYPSIHIQ